MLRTVNDETVRIRRRPEAVFERRDVDAILSGLFDIRRELIRIRVAIEEDENGEEEENDAPS